jgi:hypothetical protein
MELIYNLAHEIVKDGAPAIGAPPDHDGVGPSHAASLSAAGCRPLRKSAARCAWLAAVNTARLSFFKTLSHEAI